MNREPTSRIKGTVRKLYIKDKTPLCEILISEDFAVEVICPLPVLKALYEKHEVNMVVDHIVDDRYMLKYMLFENPDPVEFDTSNPNNCQD